jgi:hypothetical protein
MATGDITDEYDERLSGTNGAKPITGFKKELVIANGTSSKEETVDKNMLITGLYFWGPQLTTAGKTVELLLLDEDDNEIYTFGECDFSSATAADRKHARHTERGIMETTTIKVEADENVNSDRTFYLTVRGL